VNEHVGPVVLLNEAETFGVVKPLDSTFSHFVAPFFPVGTCCCANHYRCQNKKHTAKRGLCVCSALTPCQDVGQLKIYTNLLELGDISMMAIRKAS
jgi:hypothetical protein